MFGSADAAFLVRRAFERRVNECRWVDAANLLDAGDSDLCALTDTEVAILERLLWSRRLTIETTHGSPDVTGPTHWRVRRTRL